MMSTAVEFEEATS